MAPVSVIVISHDRPDDLLELLESILRQDERQSALHEVLILDNGSTIGYGRVGQFVEDHPELAATIHRSETNLGVSGGRNRLMEIAGGRVLLMLDDDVVLRDPGSLGRLSRLLDEPFFADAGCAVVSVRVVSAHTGEVQRSTFAHKRYERFVHRSRFLTSYFPGCAHLIARDAIEAVGPFPEDFFYGMEEYDLAYRLVGAGYAIGYSDSVTIPHKEAPGGRQPSAVKLRMQWVNKSKVAWRYLPRRYFVSTAALWSVNFLRRSRGDLPGFVRGLIEVTRIPFSERRRPLGREALAYLVSVDARLWY